jgi:hypothetical protein
MYNFGDEYDTRMPARKTLSTRCPCLSLIGGESCEGGVEAEEREVVAEEQRGLGPHWRRVAWAGSGNRGAGSWASSEASRMNGRWQESSGRWWQSAVGTGESHEWEMAAEEREVVAKERRGLGPRWRRVVWAGRGRAVARRWASLVTS